MCSGRSWRVSVNISEYYVAWNVMRSFDISLVIRSLFQTLRKHWSVVLIDWLIDCSVWCGVWLISVLLFLLRSLHLQDGAFIFTLWPSSLPLLREAPPLYLSSSNHRAPVSYAREADWWILRVWKDLSDWSVGVSFSNGWSSLAVLPGPHQSGWWVGGASGVIWLSGQRSDWLCSSATLWGRLQLAARCSLSERPEPSCTGVLRPHSATGNSGKWRRSHWSADDCWASCVCVCCHTLPGGSGLDTHQSFCLIKDVFVQTDHRGFWF